ncbi:MAG: potassium channel protein [Candidatus Poribacteria bacterium]|nr:potassium channel protein [Candidatus Poribacteria bacterium]
MSYQRRIIIAFSLLFVLLIIGTIGYSVLEKNNPEWGILEAVWMTVITVTTVGYGDMEMGDAARIFTMFLLIGGVGLFVYCITITTAILIEGQLLSFFKQRNMIRTVEKLSNHYIISGLGDTGVHVLEEMLKAEASFVGIEIDEERLEHLAETHDFLSLHGDATDDDVLIRAGIERAKGLVACLSRDQDNLFVVISAKKLNPSLRVVSKAVENNSPDKLVTAGADEVVLPDHIGGIRLASGILEPHLIDFFAKMQVSRQTTRFAESIIQPDSKLNGITIEEANIKEETGLVVIAIRSKDGTYIYNPSGDLKIEAGDALFVISDQRQLQTLHKLTEDTR